MNSCIRPRILSCSFAFTPAFGGEHYCLFWEYFIVIVFCREVRRENSG